MAQTGDYTTVDFTTDPTWTASTITARTGVIYKYVAPGGTTANQYLVAILDFGADITSTGFCAAGTNGQTNTVVGSAASTYTQFIGTADTIDCTIAGAAAATGRLRVYATVIDCNDHGAVDRATEVDRDLLA